MKTNVFDCDSYKNYLQLVIEAQPRSGHGYKARLADAIGCQRTFVSQVLHDEAHFNLEHGEKINNFLDHSPEESHFFLLLIQYERAGTEGLRTYFQQQMQKVREARLVLRTRLKDQTELSPEAKQHYYSAWFYSAVCIALTIPGVRTRARLMERLSLSRDTVNEILDFLQGVGLVEQVGDEFLPIAKQIHLGNDSALAAVHHAAWRARTMQAFTHEGPRDVHYSAVVSLSKAHALELKKMAVAYIESVNTKVKASPEETLCAFCLDFYEL